MSNIIKFKPIDSGTIDLATLKANNRKLATGLIAAPIEQVTYEVAAEHTSEPIKSLEDVERISDYLISTGRYRDNMLFIVGINFGLRVSDLLSLRFSHLINDNLVFKDSFPILEKKTKNTRKHKRNRYITINQAVIEAVTLYLENTPDITLSDYMFRSTSNHGKNSGAPLSRSMVDKILKGLGRELNLPYKIATHTLRKTFCFHQMVMSNNDPRKLLLLQRMLGHASSAQTLDYIGITGDEIEEAYRKLNLGSKSYNYLIDSLVVERSPMIG